jgi:transposase
MAMTDQIDKGVSDKRLRLPERAQVVWRASCVDDLLPAGHRARTIWAVVCGLDLSSFYQPIKARDGVCGRDSTDPRLLVSLWLYASIRGVGSARELERLSGESRPYQWLCGQVSVNHHLLSDFRTDHADALDQLFTNVIATLVKKGLVSVKRISQDGLRVRNSAGSASFRRGSTLAKLQEEAGEQVKGLRELLDDPRKGAGISARRKAAKLRGARERVERIKEAVELIPKLKERQERSARRLSKKQQEQQQREPRASTTDRESSRMKMGDGGFRPATNVQLAVDTHSRAIVGVEVSGEGVDYEQSEPMRQQVEERSGEKVVEHLYDGGYVKTEGIERAAAAGVTVYGPPKPPKNKEKNGAQFTARQGESPAVGRWRERMGSEEGKAIYKQRASTSETVNAQMRRQGLTQLTVRGLKKVRCVVLWSALAYNLSLFAAQLMS